VQPRIAAAWRDGRSGELLSEVPPAAPRQTGLRAETISALQRMMAASVTYGLANHAKVTPDNQQPGVAGKTGSAEWADDVEDAHAWFTGYFPVEQPRIALAVIVERSGLGPFIAAPIARYFFESGAAARYVAEAGR
jgi:cell division protein FtsI/penicillin-binding protein 2